MKWSSILLDCSVYFALIFPLTKIPWNVNLIYLVIYLLRLDQVKHLIQLEGSADWSPWKIHPLASQFCQMVLAQLYSSKCYHLHLGQVVGHGTSQKAATSFLSDLYWVWILSLAFLCWVEADRADAAKLRKDKYVPAAGEVKGTPHSKFTVI